MGTEKRLIIPDELISEIEILYQKHYVNSYSKTVHDIFNAIRRRIRKCSTVYAVEVVHGRWLPYHEADIGYDEYGIRCSNCRLEFENHEVTFPTNYCPNCGAKMDGGTV